MHFLNLPNELGLCSAQQPVLIFFSILAFCELVSSGLPELNIQDANSIRGAAEQVAHDLMGFYTGNQSGQTPGLLPAPYYQWEAGGMLMTMMDYFYYTGDPTYNDVVTQGMLWQAGPNNDFMDANQSHVEGNDDQAFWGFAALSAAEQGFPDPPSGSPPWIELAENLFNDQASRWDTTTCNGGLRWQIFSYMSGYDYKSTIANGAFFNIAARLALYTGNDTYAQWANKAYDWTVGAGYMTSDYTFYDGAHTEDNCSDITKLQWTYNLGAFLHGAASMYSYTGSSNTWKQRIDGMVKASSVFVLKDVVYEPSCEPFNNCGDQHYSLKSYLIRWLAATTKLAPFVQDQVMPVLQGTAKAAAAQCTGGDSGTMCGMKWTDGTWDGTQGVGQQMGALQAITAPLIGSCPSINKKKVTPTDPLAGGHPDSTGLGQQPSSISPPASSVKAQAAPQSLTEVALPCPSCSGGSTTVSAPPSVLSSIQYLASASGVAAAQSAAAEAIADIPTAALAASAPTGTGPAPTGAAGSGMQSIPGPGSPAIQTNSDGSAGLPTPVADTFTSTTVVLGGSTVVQVAALDTPTGSAGAGEPGSAVSAGKDFSSESVVTGGANGIGFGLGRVVLVASLCGFFYIY